MSTGKCQQASVRQQTASKSPNLSQHVSQSPKKQLLLATGKCRPANVNRQVFVCKLSQRVPNCPSMSHIVPNISFCWRQASVDWQMSTGKLHCSSNCRNMSQHVPTCPNKSQIVLKYCLYCTSVTWSQQPQQLR